MESGLELLIVKAGWEITLSLPLDLFNMTLTTTTTLKIKAEFMLF